MKAFKAVKKPIEIEAIRLTDDTLPECIKFLGDKSLGGNYVIDPISGEATFPKFTTFKMDDTDKHIIIKTLEGEHICSFGDYIIKGIKGEFYPCKPDIFKLTYDFSEEK